MTITPTQIDRALSEAFAAVFPAPIEEQARQLHQQGRVRKQIAHDLGIPYSSVCKILPRSHSRQVSEATQ